MVWAPISLTEHVKDSDYYPSFLTDQRYLQVTFSLPSVVTRGPGYWKLNTLNTSVLRDLEYCEFVKSFWSFWQAHESTIDFSSPLEGWDMGKFYLRELSRSFCKDKVMAASQTKHSLIRRFNQLQRQMDEQKKTMSGIIDPSSGTVHPDPLEILGIWRSYYSELFSA